jgi:integron integrase
MHRDCTTRTRTSLGSPDGKCRLPIHLFMMSWRRVWSSAPASTSAARSNWCAPSRTAPAIGQLCALVRRRLVGNRRGAYRVVNTLIAVAAAACRGRTGVKACIDDDWGKFPRWSEDHGRQKGNRHPRELGPNDLRAFLDSLVNGRSVSEGTHHQALCAIVFLYRRVLDQEMPWLDSLSRPRRVRHLPVVLTREELHWLLNAMHGVPGLMAMLLYGAGLRLLECASLRVKDIEFCTNQIIVRQGKGKKDRVTLLSRSCIEQLRQHLHEVKLQHERDLAAGAGYAELPAALAAKYPGAAQEWAWQWAFPATRQYRDGQTGQFRRHHLHETVLQRAVKTAVKAAGITKLASCHSLRHYALPRTCWKPATTSEPSSNCSGTAMWPPR